jgi:hypothetical protein
MSCPSARHACFDLNLFMIAGFLYEYSCAVTTKFLRNVHVRVLSIIQNQRDTSNNLKEREYYIWLPIFVVYNNECRQRNTRKISFYSFSFI